MTGKAKTTVDCAKILKVISDETRLKVIKQLLKQPKQVNELNKNLPVSQSLLSHHLKILRDVGLVTAERHGKAVVYDIVSKMKSLEGKHTIDLGCCQLSFSTRRGRL